MPHLAGDAEGVRQVQRPEEDAVECRELQDLGQSGDATGALHHQQHGNVPVGLGEPFGAAGIVGAADEGVGAAIAVGGEAGRAHGTLGLGDGADLRHDHPGGAGIERRTDLGGFAAAHPHQRIDAACHGGEDQRAERLAAMGAVLEIEDDAVVTGERDQLDQLHRRDDREWRQQRHGGLEARTKRRQRHGQDLPVSASS